MLIVDKKHWCSQLFVNSTILFVGKVTIRPTVWWKIRPTAFPNTG